MVTNEVYGIPIMTFGIEFTRIYYLFFYFVQESRDFIG